MPVVHSLLARQVDGLVWAVPEVGENRAWLADEPKLPLPCVFLSMEARPGVSVVTVDNLAGSALAVRHLIERGYRAIGHVAGPQDWWEGRQRLQGWRETLRAAGLPAEERQWAEGNWSSASGKTAFEQLADRFPEMDAVFVANDQMALAVLQCAAGRGLAVPGRLAVVGFDGLPETAYYWPALSTVFQDQQAVGGAAVELLVRQIEAQQSGSALASSEYVRIEPTLLERDSG
jgi:LacI family transcriptional regulator